MNEKMYQPLALSAILNCWLSWPAFFFFSSGVLSTFMYRHILRVNCDAMYRRTENICAHRDNMLNK